MATVKAIIKPNKLNKEGKAPIVIRITRKKSNTTFSIKRYIEPKFWNHKSARSKVRSSYPGSAQLNLKINKTVDEVQALIDSKVNQPIKPTDIVSQYLKGESITDLVTFMDNYIELNPDNLSWGTLKNYRKVKNCVSQFHPNVDLNSIDLDWIKKYEKHLIESNKATNTIHDRMKILKRICNVAIEQGFLTEYPFRFYKSKRQETNREFLSIDELKLVENYEPKSKSKSLCKDIFLFSCYTGLRFGDICILTKKNFKQKGKEIILNVRLQKTKSIITFPLPVKSKEILNRYKSAVYSFPIIDDIIDVSNEARLKSNISARNAYFNKVLKQIISECKIDKRISFHCARHTFATVGLTLGIRIEILQKLLGHKNIRETQIYAKIVDEQKSSAMKLWDKF